MKFKDYYAVLGVANDADLEQIKKAYRKLARADHPDMSKAAVKGWGVKSLMLAAY